MKEKWFEVFIDEGEEIGTHTIGAFDSEEEAVQYAEEYQQAHPHFSVHVDEWGYDKFGTPMPVRELL